MQRGGTGALQADLPTSSGQCPNDNLRRAPCSARREASSTFSCAGALRPCQADRSSASGDPTGGFSLGCCKVGQHERHVPVFQTNDQQQTGVDHHHASCLRCCSKPFPCCPFSPVHVTTWSFNRSTACLDQDNCAEHLLITHLARSVRRAPQHQESRARGLQ